MWEQPPPGGKYLLRSPRDHDSQRQRHRQRQRHSQQVQPVLRVLCSGWWSLFILSSMGISGKAHSWFESYLTGHSFNVSWQGQLSVPHRLTTGVPQGSVMGPLLFAIYTTSLGPIIRSHGFSYHCYADDTQLFLSFPPEDTTVSARISDCLADISTWMKNHHLQLNLAKTELMVFPAKQVIHHNIKINTDSLSLAPSKTARNLGIIIDDQLTFTAHIASVSRSCRFALYNIRKIRRT